MRRLFCVLSILFSMTVSLGQDDIYWPEHEGMTGARWSPDGHYIATWGESPLVRIWRDHDGTLAYELDHSELIWALPGGKVLSRPKLFGMLNVYWSADGQYVLTQAFVDNFIFQLAWNAETRVLTYSYLWAERGYGGYRDGRRFMLHQLLIEDRLVASWYRKTVSFVDIDTSSITAGEELATIDLGELDSRWEATWNVNQSQALLFLSDNWRPYCEDCHGYMALYNTDLRAETFGERLWQVEVAGPDDVHLWPNPQNIAVVYRADVVEVWDLDRESDQFGMTLARMELASAELYDVLYHESNQRLVIIQVKIVRLNSETYWRWEKCIVNECDFVVEVWDVNTASSDFGQQVTSFRHPYRLRPGDRGAFLDNYRVRLNQTATQVHFYWISAFLPNRTVRLNDAVAAFDLITGVAQVARHRWPAQKFYRESRSVFAAPPFEIDLGLDRETWWWDTVSVNPKGNKAIVFLQAYRWTGGDFWLLVDTETGEYFRPPDGWTETLFRG